jgi:FHA domain
VEITRVDVPKSLGVQATTVRARTRGRPDPLSSSEESGTVRGISLEVLEGPMDGTVLVGSFERVKIGRAPGNDLELHSDRSVSSDHAVLRRGEDGGWILEDHHSTNGTWLDGTRIVTPQPLPLDTDFMAGHTVLRFSAAVPGDESFTPGPQQLQEETARLVGLFSPETSEGYGAAVALAGGELKPYLGDRLFFLGLAAMNPDLPILARNQGPISPRFLAETLRRNEAWTGSKAWIQRQLRALAIEVACLFKDELVTTPRLVRLLLAAEGEAQRAGSPLIRPVDVLRTFFAGPLNRPRELLTREGIDSESLLALLGTSPGERPIERPRGKTSAPEAAVAPAPPPVPSSGAPALDARAQELARGLYGVATLYQLAAAEDRTAAMRQFLLQEISHIPADGRSPLLRQVQRLFPVTSGPAVTVAVASPSERTGRRKKPVTVEEPPPLPSGGVVPWRAVLEGGKDPALAGLDPNDRTAAELFLDLHAFSTAIERFIVSIVQNLRSPGVGTETLQLPGARTSIPRFTRDLLAGKSPRRETLKEYLTAVETWLVAAVAAYHEGPDLWFKEFWRKVSPAAIESPLAEENKKKRLNFGIDSLEYWSRYKERVRTINPDLVSDEISHLVRRRVHEQYNLLYERRKPS